MFNSGLTRSSKFDGKVCLINYYMEGTYKGEFS